MLYTLLHHTGAVYVAAMLRLLLRYKPNMVEVYRFLISGYFVYSYFIFYTLYRKSMDKASFLGSLAITANNYSEREHAMDVVAGMDSLSACFSIGGFACL